MALSWAEILVGDSPVAERRWRVVPRPTVTNNLLDQRCWSAAPDSVGGVDVQPSAGR